MGEVLEGNSGAEILNVCTCDGGGLWHAAGGQVVVENTRVVVVIVWCELTVVHLGGSSIVQRVLLERS